MEDPDEVVGDLLVDSVLEPHDVLLVGVGQRLLEVGDALGRVVAVVRLAAGVGLVVDDLVRVGRHRVQVLRERRPVHRREEVVGQHVAVGVLPVGRDAPAPLLHRVRVLCRRDLARVVERRVPGEVRALADDVVAVHPAAVDRVQPRGEPVCDVVRLHVVAGPQRHGRAEARAVLRAARAVRGLALGGAVRAVPVRPEVVVERAVLLDQEDHVLDGGLPGLDHCGLRAAPVRRSLRPAVAGRTCGAGAVRRAVALPLVRAATEERHPAAHGDRGDHHHDDDERHERPATAHRPPAGRGAAPAGRPEQWIG